MVMTIPTRKFPNRSVSTPVVSQKNIEKYTFLALLIAGAVYRTYEIGLPIQKVEKITEEQMI